MSMRVLILIGMQKLGRTVSAYTHTHTFHLLYPCSLIHQKIPALSLSMMKVQPRAREPRGTLTVPGRQNVDRERRE